MPLEFLKSRHSLCYQDNNLKIGVKLKQIQNLLDFSPIPIKIQNKALILKHRELAIKAMT